MTNYESIIATLSVIDNQHDFAIRNDTEIAAILRNNLADNEGKLDEFALAEFYAFTLLENSSAGEKHWNTYFGSPREQHISGEITERVPMAKITREIIQYWKERLDKSKSPILIARYAAPQLFRIFPVSLSNINMVLAEIKESGNGSVHCLPVL